MAGGRTVIKNETKQKKKKKKTKPIDETKTCAKLNVIVAAS